MVSILSCCLNVIFFKLSFFFFLFNSPICTYAYDLITTKFYALFMYIYIYLVNFVSLHTIFIDFSFTVARVYFFVCFYSLLLVTALNLLYTDKFTSTNWTDSYTALLRISQMVAFCDFPNSLWVFASCCCFICICNCCQFY